MTTPTSAAQPDPAPPSDAEVEAALGELCGYNEGDFTRTGTVLGSCIDALRSENAALTAERDEAKKQAEIAVNSQRTICRAAERLTAERDALRGEVDELVGASADAAIRLIVKRYDMVNGDNESNRAEFHDLLDDELSRLKAQGEAPSDE